MYAFSRFVVGLLLKEHTNLVFLFSADNLIFLNFNFKLCRTNLEL